MAALPTDRFSARALPTRVLSALTVVLLLVSSGAAAVAVRPDARQDGKSPGTATPQGGAAPFARDLAGAWRFQTGDDPSWADPAFDDSGWETAQVPQEGGQPVFADYDGYAWFRLEFKLPAGARGTPLVAALGGIDDADETYLNGELIGRTGTFPPDSNSQWFEQRLYPVPGSLPRFRGRNVLAVRMNDFTGGGGWYRGPVGLFSKAALRTELYDLDTSPVGRQARERVTDVLQRQARAVHTGRFRAYRRTLSPSFFHDGDTRDRRVSDLRSFSRQFGPLRLRDAEIQVVRDNRSGALIADTNRSLLGHRADGRRIVIEEVRQDFLYLRGNRMKEQGNRSRFFTDSVTSRLEGQRRDFAVYLPPSYVHRPERRYPTTYLLHGINGGAAEWQTRNIDERIDRLVRRRGIAESIVIMPDAESLWYVDSSESPWRSMFTEELLPLVDGAYRTRPTRGMRGLTGVSMGGHGAFTIGWAHPELFSSIASHMGALDLPPLAGTPEDQAANADETPVLQVTGHPTDFLRRFRYFFDACQDDDFDFDDAARAMSAHLTAKEVPHRTAIYPTGRHNDECWVPRLRKSFDLHSDNFRRHGLHGR